MSKAAKKPVKNHIEMVLVRWELVDLECDRTGWAWNPKEPDAPFLYQFLVDDGVDLKEAVKEASAEYLCTQEGRDAHYGDSDDHDLNVRAYGYDPFTWIMVWDEVPDAMLEKRGVRKIKDGGITVHEACTDEPAVKYAQAWDWYFGEAELEHAEAEYGVKPSCPDCPGLPHACWGCEYAERCSEYAPDETDMDGEYDPLERGYGADGVDDPDDSEIEAPYDDYADCYDGGEGYDGCKDGCYRDDCPDAHGSCWSCGECLAGTED